MSMNARILKVSWVSNGVDVVMIERTFCCSERNKFAAAGSCIGFTVNLSLLSDHNIILLNDVSSVLEVNVGSPAGGSGGRGRYQWIRSSVLERQS